MFYLTQSSQSTPRCHRGLGQSSSVKTFANFADFA
jgi:hypothetical protein